MPKYVHRCRVEFRDTDAAGIAHFSVFPVWMEQAEHAALRHIGLSVMDREAGVSWPRVSVSCDFKSPVIFEDLLEIHVTVSRLGEKSVTYAFEFYSDQRAVATGRITAVCCRQSADGGWHATTIPAAVKSKLELLSL